MFPRDVSSDLARPQGAPRLVAPPPGMMRPPSVVDQLAGLAPQV